MDDYYLQTKNYSRASSPWSLSISLTNRSLNYLKEALVNRSWTPLLFIARTTIVGLLRKISRGQLRVRTQNGMYTFGSPSSVPGDGLRAEISVLNDAFWVRMFLLSDLGFAEAYMLADIEVDDLDALFKLFILNRSDLAEMSMATSSVFASLTALMNSRFINSISNSISNISAHYDISNDMFKAFLSPDMTYSCAYFPPALGGLTGDLAVSKVKRNPGKDELEMAQYAKLDMIIQKARIRKGDRVLEIGSGWGSFAIRAVQKAHCQVDTITLSVEQKALAEEQIKLAGLEGSIRVHLVDYRNLPTQFSRAFDRVVSIEMAESVGLEFLETYFGIVEQCLKPPNGIAVFQVITIPERRFEQYVKQVDFIRKWIFPGGILPTVTLMTNAISKGTKNRLIIDSIENIGPHYARTLREWHRRFEDRFESNIAPALISTYPQLVSKPKDIEIFRRKWIYYFSYCATGFESRVLGDHIFTVTHEGNLSLDSY